VARPKNSAEDVASTREALLQAAQALFEKGGTEAMSFRAIASSAGCSHSKLYSYFDSKADIVDALRLRAYGLLTDRLIGASEIGESPLESLRGLADAYMRFGLEQPRMYGLLYSREGQMGESDYPLYEAKVAALGVCRDAIAAAADAGLVDLAVDPLTAAHIFWSGAHGLVELELGGFLVMGRTVDGLSTDLVAVLINGLSWASD
jgi:AcrR family transcriptional regulator